MAFIKEAEIFMKEGRVTLPFSSRNIVLGLNAEFLRFCANPLEFRKIYTIPILDDRDPDKKPDNGYLRKDGDKKESGGYNDKKDIWHDRDWNKEWYEKNGIDITPVREIIRLSKILRHRCIRLLEDFLRDLDVVLPGYDFFDRSRYPYATEAHVLRTNLYDPADPGQIQLGKEHSDRDAFTFHVSDNRPGLILGEKRTLYTAKPDTVLVFPGDNAELLTGGILTALKHRIWETNPKATDRRSSNIFFGHVYPIS